MATQLVLLVSQCPVALLELVHLLPGVRLTHGDLDGANLGIDGLALATQIGCRDVVLLLLLSDLCLVLATFSGLTRQILLFELQDIGRLADSGNSPSCARRNVSEASRAELVLCVDDLALVTTFGRLCARDHSNECQKQCDVTHSATVFWCTDRATLACGRLCNPAPKVGVSERWMSRYVVHIAGRTRYLAAEACGAGSGRYGCLRAHRARASIVMEMPVSVLEARIRSRKLRRRPRAAVDSLKLPSWPVAITTSANPTTGLPPRRQQGRHARVPTV